MLAQEGRACSGCEFWPQDFLALDRPQTRFDGIFADASLFHLPSQEVPRVLPQLAADLKPARTARDAKTPCATGKARIAPLVVG
jgi:hypothetical protein